MQHNNHQHSTKQYVNDRDVNSWEISLTGIEAQIPGLIRVSIWTVVIRFAKRWQ